MNGPSGTGPLAFTATPSTSASGAQLQAFASAALTVVLFTVLLMLGALLGLTASFGAGWLTRYWEAGQPVPLIATAALLAYLALLYGACRLAAWGSRRVSGAIAFTFGYIAALTTLVFFLPGGDTVITGHLIHYGYLFGTMLVLVIGIAHAGASTLRR